MATFKNKQAHSKLIKARTVLLVSQPFYGCLALHLELIEETDPTRVWGNYPPTMAVDGRHMYYWPEFILKLTEVELTGVVAHEVMHCAYHHMTRRQHRHPTIFNYAGDFVINGDLLKAGFTLPKPHLHDPKYDNLSTEEVYERIKQDVEKQMAKGGGKGKDGQGLDDKGGCGGVLDASPKHDPAKAEEIRREWEGNVRLAVNIARAANAGKLPGHLERLVKQLAKPRINWRDQTRQFIDASMTKDYSYKRPNRRYQSSGLIMPGFVPDALHHMVFIGDISGSVGIEMMRAMVSEVAGALDEGTADALTVLYADTHVRHVDEYVQGDIVECKSYGGGGTCFVDALEWVRKHTPDAACCVYLTDMMPSHWNLPDPEIPVLWAAFCPEQYLHGIKVPFGDIIRVECPQ